MISDFEMCVQTVAHYVFVITDSSVIISGSFLSLSLSGWLNVLDLDRPGGKGARFCRRTLQQKNRRHV